MASRAKRKSIAEETLAIMSRGEYQTATGQSVAIQPALQHAIEGTICYRPADFETVVAACSKSAVTSQQHVETRFEVLNTTTFAAAKQLVSEDASRRVVCLNFASARSPGGGFLSGAQAQEECLARASGLYACINPQQQYYEANRNCQTSLYTNHLIYSPDVPVFRNDDDELLDEVYKVSIITVPAVNAGAVKDNEPANVHKIPEVMIRRIEYLLSIARLHGHDSIVLGAWGCGVFRNDPRLVAQWFHDQLCGQGGFHQAFDRVTFAVLDNTEQHSVIEPFQKLFGSVNAS